MIYNFYKRYDLKNGNCNEILRIIYILEKFHKISHALILLLTSDPIFRWAKNHVQLDAGTDRHFPRK